MPRRKPKERRKISVPWRGIGWVLFLIALPISFFLSPLTSLRTVRAVGFLAEDRPGLEKQIQPLRNTPWIRLAPDQVRTGLLKNQDLESVHFESNVFGRGLVKAVRRKAVAIIDPDAKILLSDRGEVFRTAQELPISLSLQLSSDALGVGGTLIGSWDSGKIAELCADLRDKVPNLSWNVEVDPRSVITLRAEGVPTIILGGSDDLSKKVQRLVDIFAKKPDLVRRASELNLTAPDEPVYKSK